MDRYALLIEGSNIKGLKSLPGAENDVIAMREYLMSSVGGEWRDDEIVTINQMRLRKIRTMLMRHIDDFCFVYFSGHGSEEVRGVPTVCLNDNELDVSVTDLYPAGNYGIVITDCCRGNEQESLNESVEFENFLIRTASDINGISRKLWDLALEKCIEDNKTQGIVEMLSCGYNEVARETRRPDAHGIYTNALLKEAKLWQKTAKSKKYLSTLGIHNRIYEYMVRQGQHPSYAPENLKYPFAVKA